MVTVLAEDEKLLLRFHNTINKQVTREDIDNYIRQVDIIADLELLKEKKASDEQIKEVCKKYWNNSSVRRYYIDICMKKKEIYFLQGNRNAYIEQLWQLVLEHKAGNLNLYRELKKQCTIKTIYPIEVVDFFCEHHSMEAIAKDIENGYVSVLKIDENIVATGSYVDNHITRVYVLPEYQKKSFINFHKNKL